MRCQYLSKERWSKFLSIFFTDAVKEIIATNPDSRRTTVCPRSSDPFYIVSYYIKWVTTSWRYSMRSLNYSCCI